MIECLFNIFLIIVNRGTMLHVSPTQNSIPSVIQLEPLTLSTPAVQPANRETSSLSSLTSVTPTCCQTIGSYIKHVLIRIRDTLSGLCSWIYHSCHRLVTKIILFLKSLWFRNHPPANEQAPSVKPNDL